MQKLAAILLGLLLIFCTAGCNKTENKIDVDNVNWT